MFRWLPLVWANLQAPQAAPRVHVHLHPAGVPDVRHAGCAAHQPVAGREPGRRGPPDAAEQGEHHGVELPRSHYEKVKAVPGVRAVAPFNWFGGVYKDSKQQIQVQATDPEEFMKVYPEVHAQAGGTRGLEARSAGHRSSGQALADQYGWKVGAAHSDALGHLAQGRRQRYLGIQHRRHLRRRAARAWDKAQRDVPVRLLQRVVAVRQGPGGLDGDPGRRSRRVRQDRQRASTRCSPTRRTRPRPRPSACSSSSSSTRWATSA